MCCSLFFNFLLLDPFFFLLKNALARDTGKKAFPALCFMGFFVVVLFFFSSGIETYLNNHSIFPIFLLHSLFSQTAKKIHLPASAISS